ncbi:MAG TPA: PHB depolymerase family esterase [Myxococcota bacterium]|jgi:predicted esterase|nr:PHB depolymerase family esterase [Myxococcota bacterium]
MQDQHARKGARSGAAPQRAAAMAAVAGALLLLTAAGAAGCKRSGGASDSGGGGATDAGTDAAPSGTDSGLPAVACPATLVPGVNIGFPSDGYDRSLILAVPSYHDVAQEWPVVFVWHWLGGDAASMLAASGMEPRAESEGILVVAPESRRLPLTEWEFFNADPSTNPDITFFDEMLACLEEQYNVDEDRVYSTGMSAGGLWTSYLGVERADVHAALAPASGGLFVSWVPPASKPPELVIWGGVSDMCCTVDFNQMALDMIADLRSNDQFVVGCNHDMGHTWPYPVTGEYVWQFFADHVRGVTPDPYEGAALPAVFPSYCTIEP